MRDHTAQNPGMLKPSQHRTPIRRQKSHHQQQQQSSSFNNNENTSRVSTPSLESQPPTPLPAPFTSPSPSRGITKYHVGWRRVIRHFTPSWFSITMGTGVVAQLLITIPFKTTWLYWLSVIMFCLNTILFSTAMIISILRYTLWPEIWHVMLADHNSLFLGTIPMGFATLIQCWVKLVVPYWGYWSVQFAWGCWIVDAVAALGVTLSLTVLVISFPEEQGLNSITATQLLPIAATIVAAGVGGTVAPELRNPQLALATVLASYVMWGMAVPLSMSVLVIYYQRLALHKLPGREVVVSSFLPLGPLGMGGYAVMRLGAVSHRIFPKTNFFESEGIEVVGDIFYVLGLFCGLIMWGFGLTWLVFALASIYKSRPFPFNMAWWGFTFPLGVYAISTIEFGTQMPSLFFRVLGTVFGVMVILLWMVVAAGTVRGIWDGKLLHSPALSDFEEKREKEEEEGEKGYGAGGEDGRSR